MNPTKTFSLGDAFRFGWRTFLDHAFFFLSLAFLSLAIPQILEYGSKSLQMHNMPLSTILGIASVFFGILLRYNGNKIILSFVDGTPLSLNSLFHYEHGIWTFLFATILFAIAFGVGLILVVIPGIMVGLIYGFYTYVIVDKHVGIRASFAASARITKGVRMKILQLIIASLCINIIGFAIFFIGIFVTIPVTILAWGYIYRVLDLHTNRAPEVPESSHSPEIETPAATPTV